MSANKSDSVKINVSFYFPAVLAIIGESKFAWEHLEQIFWAEIHKREKRIIEEGTEIVKVDANIYDIILAVKKNNKQAIHLLDWFNKIMFNLNSVLSENEKKMVLSNIWNMLTALDWRYLDFVGEMAVLNSMMISGKYRLGGIEYKLPNGRTIDFLLKGQNGDLNLVEVYNIHLKSDKVKLDNTSIEKFLAGRINAKIKRKMDGLSENIIFDLVPVIWGTSDDLKVYSNHLKHHSINIDNVHEPFSYSTFTDLDNELFFGRFMRLRNLFS